MQQSIAVYFRTVSALTHVSQRASTFDTAAIPLLTLTKDISGLSDTSGTLPPFSAVAVTPRPRGGTCVGIPLSRVPSPHERRAPGAL